MAKPRHRARSRLVSLVIGGVIGGALFACNVFVSVDRCETDADCPERSTCDPEGRFCTEPAPVADASDASDAADAADARDAAQPDVFDAGPPVCDTHDVFTSFALVKGFEGTPILSARLLSNERTIVFSALNGCSDEACLDLFVASRADRNTAFGVGSAISALDCNESAEYWPTFSADNKLVFFESGRALSPSGGSCGNDRSRIWSATRVNTSTDFGAPRIDAVFSQDAGSVESSPYLHPDGRSLYFVSLGRPGAGAQDLYVATIDPAGLLTTVSEVTAANTALSENFPVITLDDKTLYFTRNEGPREVMVTHRSSPGGAFGTPTKVPGFDAPTDFIPAWISDDACRFYFVSNRVSPDGGTVSDYRLWVAERAPR